jgi:outer membrane protein TolC
VRVARPEAVPAGNGDRQESLTHATERRHKAEIGEAHTMLSKADVNLSKVQEEVTVAVELAYDNVEQMLASVTVAEEVLKVRTEGSRLANSRFEQGALQ